MLIYFVAALTISVVVLIVVLMYDVYVMGHVEDSCVIPDIKYEQKITNKYLTDDYLKKKSKVVKQMRRAANNGRDFVYINVSKTNVDRMICKELHSMGYGILLHFETRYYPHYWHNDIDFDYDVVR